MRVSPYTHEDKTVGDSPLTVITLEDKTVRDSPLTVITLRTRQWDTPVTLKGQYNGKDGGEMLFS